MKIFQIVENLDNGAVENWLVRTFLESRKIKPEWKWTFYCILGKEGRLDAVVKKAGGEIIYSPVTVSNKFFFLKHLRHTLQKGKYDVLHSHHDYLSGFYLLASRGIRFKRRVLHIHNTDKVLPVGNRFLHRLLLNPLRKIAFHYSDTVVGISKDTLNEFVGDKKKGRKKFTVLYYGIDFSEFEKPVVSTSLKKELGLPAESKLLLFVGRMNEFKNPVFVVEILNELLKECDDIYALFVGKGNLETEVQKRAEVLGISKFIRLMGWRDDTQAIMKSSDVFIFPRREDPKEGLGLVVVEAQAAGLPMILSYGIVEDAIVVNELVHFVSINNPAQNWASIVKKIISNLPLVTKEEALEKLKQSPFELQQATKNFLDLYED